jgi:hypothetical protein
LILHRGRRKIELPWQEIRGLYLHNAWQSIPLLRSGRPRLLVIDVNDSQQLRLTNDLEHFERLVESIKGRVYPRMHRALATAFNQGQRIPFGPLTMAPAGLQWRGTTTAWDQIDSASLKQGRLVIRDRGGNSLRLPASRVPNADLCLQMIESMVQA